MKEVSIKFPDKIVTVNAGEIAENKAKYYHENYGEDYFKNYKLCFNSNTDLLDWLQNNMNLEDTNYTVDYLINTDLTDWYNMDMEVREIK